MALPGTSRPYSDSRKRVSSHRTQLDQDPDEDVRGLVDVLRDGLIAATVLVQALTLSPATVSGQCCRARPGS